MVRIPVGYYHYVDAAHAPVCRLRLRLFIRGSVRCFAFAGSCVTPRAPPRLRLFYAPSAVIGLFLLTVWFCTPFTLRSRFDFYYLCLYRFFTHAHFPARWFPHQFGLLLLRLLVRIMPLRLPLFFYPHLVLLYRSPPPSYTPLRLFYSIFGYSRSHHFTFTFPLTFTTHSSYILPLTFIPFPLYPFLCQFFTVRSLFYWLVPIVRSPFTTTVSFTHVLPYAFPVGSVYLFWFPIPVLPSPPVPSLVRLLHAFMQFILLRSARLTRSVR